jgi:hypothetical protein
MVLAWVDILIGHLHTASLKNETVMWPDGFFVVFWPLQMQNMKSQGVKKGEDKNFHQSHRTHVENSELSPSHFTVVRAYLSVTFRGFEGAW